MLNNMDTYGYARVSTRDQNLERQLQALMKFGIKEKYIFCDKQSGKNFDRKAYNALVGTDLTVPLLHAGDLLVIYSIDRLGRNYTDIQAQWQYITKTLQVDIKVLDMPLLDTRGFDGNDLDRAFICDLVLQLLSYVAEKERDNTRSRQRQGINVMPLVNGKRTSLKTGRAIGRPAATYPENWAQIYPQWKEKKITAIDAMNLMNLKKATFYNLVKRYEIK